MSPTVTINCVSQKCLFLNPCR